MILKIHSLTSFGQDEVVCNCIQKGISNTRRFLHQPQRHNRIQQLQTDTKRVIVFKCYNNQCVCTVYTLLVEQCSLNNWLDICYSGSKPIVLWTFVLQQVRMKFGLCSSNPWLHPFHGRALFITKATFWYSRGLWISFFPP